ncbi:DUF1801 domain-containing protein [Actinoplanes sp. NPDC051633]|uniref:iron chaperone n=1 Tax=Actinoplanes sp. NPDC051633 TaxID=3155670 RepID=UPI0034341962
MAARQKSETFTAEERAAMKERAQEMKARRGASKADEESAVLAKIAEMEEPDRGLAERIHAIVKESVPEMTAKLWYGMPAYWKDGKNVCFFQPALKFKARYATLGFNDPAKLDDGTMWPTSWALTKMTKANEKAIADLVKRAAS